MKFNAIKKVDVAEFPAAVQSWVAMLVNPLNRFFETTYLALTNGLTIKDNLKARTFDVSVAENQKWPMKVSWTLNERPSAVLIGHVSSASNAAIPVYSLQWTFNNGNIEFNVAGLLTNDAYTVRLVGMV